MSTDTDTSRPEPNLVTIHARIAEVEPRGHTFYAPARDVLARLLTGLAWAVLVFYAALLVAWWAGGAS